MPFQLSASFRVVCHDRKFESLEATDDVVRIARDDHRPETDHDAVYARVD